MLSLLQSVLGFALAIFLVSFALAHRAPVEVFYSPVHDPLSLPLYALVLGFTAFGFVLGGVIVWIGGAKVRKEKRVQKKQIKQLEKEVAGLRKTQGDDIRVPVSELLPALGKPSELSNKNTSL